VAHAAVGCASAPAVPEAAAVVAPLPTAWTPPLDLLVAPEAYAQARLDARALLASPPFAHLAERLLRDLTRADHPGDRDELAFLGGLLPRVDEVVWFAEGAPGTSFDDPAVLMRGHFSDADLSGIAPDGQVAVYEGHSVRVEGRLAAALLSDHTLVLGPLHMVEAACDRFDGRRPTGPGAHPTLDAARARAGYGHHAVSYAVHTAPIAGGSQIDAERAITALDGYCDVADALTCELSVSATDADALPVLQERVQRVLDLFTSAPAFQAPVAVTTLLQGATFVASGSRLTLRITGTHATLSDAFDELIDTMLQLRSVRPTAEPVAGSVAP
jgi:hypothetical protein